MLEISMEFILFAMLSLIVIVALVASRLNDNSFPFPFTQKNSVFTLAEKNFLILLEQAVGPKYRVINRVKLADIVNIRNGVSEKTSQKALNNANNKYVDFIICDRETMALKGAIDLVDNNGKGYKVKKDWFVSGALEAASIPHVRIKVKATYTVSEIRDCVTSRFIKNFAPEPKIKGKVIPAALVKARAKTPQKNANVGALASAALNKPVDPQLVQQVRAAQQQANALPH